MMLAFQTLRNVGVRAPTVVGSVTTSRHFYGWINMTFNRVDPTRLKAVGPDRLCAEWLLRNGAKVKFVNGSEMQDDYDLLPKEDVPVLVEELDGTDSSIMGLGFNHLKGLTRLRKVKLHSCVYLEDDALAKLEFVADTLEELEVSNCKNLTEHGLLHLKYLKKLKQLSTHNLPYVNDLAKVEQQLKEALPNCSMDLKS